MGLGADLGADRPLRRQAPVRQGRRVAQPPVPPAQGRVVVRPGRAAPSSSSARSGEAMLNEEVDRPRRCFHFTPGTVHRVRALEDTTILEVSTPHLDDVVRLEDATGARAPRRAVTANLDIACVKVRAHGRRLTVGEAAAQTGWSPRMLRYLERAGLVVPRAHRGRLPALRAPRAEPAALARASCCGASTSSSPDVAFAARLRARAGRCGPPSTPGSPGARRSTALEWEQRKHERLLAA